MNKILRSKYTYAAAGFIIGGLFGGGIMSQIKDTVMPNTTNSVVGA